MVRSPCCSKGLSRGAWSAMEDMNLSEYIRIHGNDGWKNIPKKAGLKRCGKSCRLRWINYLRPNIKRGNISPEEEGLIIRLHHLLGNQWSLIAGGLPGRTDNKIKNYWKTHMGNGQEAVPVNEQISPRTSENRRTRSKSLVPIQNPVFKATTVKIKIVVRHSGIVRANGSNDEGSSNHISDEAFKLSNIQETRKSSWRDLLVNDSIGDEEFERIGLPLANNTVETTATHFLCSMSSIGYQQSPHYDYSGRHALSLAESSLFLNKQLSQYSNFLPSLFVCSTYFTSEDLYRAMEKDYNNEQDKECVHAFNYLQK